ncbi:hypothetical protein J7L81_01230 [Candidatus Aerophobetes bacterium]|nr:hypothetical protein [Candidatus Aerophobetes bacterium]
MLEDRKKFLSVIKSERLNFSKEPLLIKPEKKDTGDVKISFKREKGIVRIIEIICSCGNKIELLCEYENEISQKNFSER